MPKMRVLFILDPLQAIDMEWDTSFSLMRELIRRGHETWAAEIKDLAWERETVRVVAQRVLFEGLKPRKEGSAAGALLDEFSIVMNRKDPPVDEAYQTLLLMLAAAAHKVPVSNDPMGVFRTNEKLAILNFPDWIPETRVTTSTQKILEFAIGLQHDVVVKPLNHKGGHGIIRIPYAGGRVVDLVRTLDQMTADGTRPVMAQKMLKGGPHGEDKRILILNGKILSAYEKHPPDGDFRTNLSLGGTFHATHLTDREMDLVNALRPYLISQGLHFVGIDVMEEKLLEINVTSSAGIMESNELYPKTRPVEAWADFLELLRRDWKAPGSRHPGEHSRGQEAQAPSPL